MQGRLLSRTLLCILLTLAYSAPTSSANNITGTPQTNREIRVTASQSNFDDLQWASRLSSAAYAGCKDKVDDLTIAHQIQDSVTDTQGFIGYTSQRKRIVVVMRGSNSITDYLNDLDTTLVPLTQLKGCQAPASVQIMRGIYRPWSAVHDDIITQVHNLTQQYPAYAIEITGHSLGGSLAYLAFIALTQNFPRKQITSNALAAFPIGNAAFASFGTNLVTRNRVIRRGNNGGDGVPNMYTNPPISLQHFGTEFYGNGTLATTLRCTGERDVQCSAGNGALGPNLKHYMCMGVSMKVQGALACIASGGSTGINGGSATGLFRE